MKKLLLYVAVILTILSCNSGSSSEKFTVKGEIKNAADQKIYIEELFFSEKAPEVLDTGEIKSGKFSISIPQQQEGLYRLRLSNHNTGFIFINDQKDISFSADLNNLTLQSPYFNSPANSTLKNFIAIIDSQSNLLHERSMKIEQLKSVKAEDSAHVAAQKDYDDLIKSHQDYVLKFIDTTSDPVLAMFALGYTRDIDPPFLEKPVQNVIKRFPKNELIQSMAVQFNQMISNYNTIPHIGGMAPDFSMSDTSGKQFSLSMLRGKYVLVDFWASWCGPCRQENPNVVESFNKFKDKNFTVLGVSLDKDRQNWIEAIKKDNLTWNHISDLKYWNSAAVPLYRFEGIPYNVLVDPAGKIVALNLRGTDLEDKLTSLLK